MTEKIIYPPLGLINPENLTDDEKFLFSIDYDMYPEKKFGVYKKRAYLVVHTVFWSKLNKNWKFEQREFPLSALPWIVERFENGFWKTSEEGGLAVTEHSMQEHFDGERIGINPVTHCCAENLFGYSIWNASRASYIDKIPPQDWNIPRYILLDQGVFEKLKVLADAYEQGTL